MAHPDKRVITDVELRLVDGGVARHGRDLLDGFVVAEGLGLA